MTGIKKEEARTANWKRQPAYENNMAKSVGMIITCNCCDRVIWADENWVEQYQDNNGYCKECSEGIDNEFNNQ